MKVLGLTTGQLNSLLAVSKRAKSGLIRTILNDSKHSKPIIQTANGHARTTGGKTNHLYVNDLPLYIVSKLETAGEKISQTKQDIIDTFLFLSHMYTMSQTTNNRFLRDNTGKALQQLLVNYPLHIINLLHFSGDKKGELYEQLGSAKEIIALFILFSTPDDIYHPGNKNNFVNHFYR